MFNIIKLNGQILYIKLLNCIFTDEKHHRDTDEAFRKVSERASRLSKGKFLDLHC